MPVVTILRFTPYTVHLSNKLRLQCYYSFRRNKPNKDIDCFVCLFVCGGVFGEGGEVVYYI